MALSLVVIHTLLTWQLFDSNWESLIAESPVIEGQHARLLYYGRQVADSIRQQGVTATTFDPQFQAGLTISPWASIESRLAVLAYILCDSNPLATYKILLFVMWLSLPWSLWIMCRISNLGSGAISGALLLFLGCAWSPWGIQLLKQGETDVIIGTAAMGLALAHMVRSYARPRWWTPLGWFSTAATALYFWPASLLLLTFCFILFLGLLAGRLPWPRFSGLNTAFFAAIAVNFFWMRECWHTWWMLSDREIIIASSFQELFNLKANLQLMIWPGLLLVIGFLGTRTLREGIGGRSALVWSFAIVLTSTAALLPQEIESLHLDKAHGWWWCSVWLATIPVGKLLALVMEQFSRIIGGYQRSMLFMAVLFGTLGFLFREELARLVVILEKQGTMQMQVPVHVLETAARLKQLTTDEARILWEETPQNGKWSPMLPQLTERAFVGGLGRADSVQIEPLQVRLTSGSLTGKSMEQWSQNDLITFANDWNLGWVCAFHAISIQRWLTIPQAVVVADLPQGGKLIRLPRPFNYCKQGQATIHFTGQRRMTLTNLIPQDGQIILSMHYHATMFTVNHRVKLATWQQAYDGIPMLRIRTASPMERLTIEW